MIVPDRIAALTAAAIADAVRAYAQSGNVRAWERAMREAITRGHTAAAIAGTAERLGTQTVTERRLSRAERADITRRVQEQLPYLQRFAEAVRRGELSDAEVAARSGLYAGATRATYYEARNATYDLRGVPIPADGGTECLTNCKCQAYVETQGDRAVWIYELTTAEHCPTCLERASKSPYPLERRAM